MQPGLPLRREFCYNLARFCRIYGENDVQACVKQGAVPSDGGGRPQILGGRRRVSEVSGTEQGQGTLHVLRRSSVRDRPAALRSPPRRDHQGHRAALPDDARQVRGAPLRLGHARTSHRSPRAGGARHRGRARDQGARRGQVQRAVPLDGAPLRGRMAQDGHAHGPLG